MSGRKARTTIQVESPEADEDLLPLVLPHRLRSLLQRGPVGGIQLAGGRVFVR